MRSKFPKRSREEVTRPRIPAAGPPVQVPASPASDLVDRPVVGDLDLAAEGLLRLLTGPGRIQLVGDVGQHKALHLCVAAVLAGLLGRQVTSIPGALGAGERGLDQE